MKIAILGYGRMGKTIEKIALERQHEVVYKTSEGLKVEELKKAEVAIDFSIPEAAFKNITTCFKNNVPVVCGTTGWLDQFEEAIEICKKNDSAFIYASNFSLGVNLFFKLNEKLASIMKRFEDYQASIEEIHHTTKLDKPSGTAITLAEQLIEKGNYKNWTLVKNEDNSTEKDLPVSAIREADVKGTHKITYSSAIDDIEIKHTAHTREGFALGAVIAAEYIQNKKGIFTMADVLNL